MTILRRFTFPVLCIFYLVACNTTKTISIETLGDTPVITRFVFPTSGSTAEAYLTRPAGPGPFPLMILLHGHTFESIGGAESLAPEAEAFASDLCYAGLAVSLPGYGATEVPRGLDPEITSNVVLDAVSLVNKLPWIDSKRFYLYGYSRGAFFAALPKAVFYDLALSYPIFDQGRGTEAHAMMEFNAKSEWGNQSPKHFQLYLTPGFRKGLTPAGNWAIAFGVQVPVTREREANYRVLGYLLYELPPFRF